MMGKMRCQEPLIIIKIKKMLTQIYFKIFEIRLKKEKKKKKKYFTEELETKIK